MLFNLYSKRNFFLISILFSLLSLYLLYEVGFLKTGLTAAITILLILFNTWLVYLLIIPREYGKVKLRRITVAAVLLLFSGLLAIQKDVSNKIIEKLTANYPDLIKPDAHHYSSAIFIIGALTGLALLLFLFNYLLQDKTAMKEHDSSFDEVFPERDFTEKLKSFCIYLKNRIDHLDTEANWSDAHFTPIDAEVEIVRTRGKKRKIANLLKAIKNDRKSKVFLILGEPGSGKSVALRKLCRDLLNEVHKTRKIPIYINLKEWLVSKKWTEDAPPSGEDIYNFCISYLKGKDIFADEFVDRYFKRLHENGHIFFIIDSFDEIPSVLDVDESSWLIDKLSETIFNFLGGAHESRGVLASRYFRKPTAKFNANSVLNIRPFSEYKIYDALNKYISLDKNIINSIFRDRVDLLPIASNPFSVGLIYAYIKSHNSLPLSQGELYSSYIINRLSVCADKIARAHLSIEHIIHSAKEIAIFMLSKENFGLEVSITELKQQFRNQDIESIIDILVYARIGRIGKGEESRFSFVHRRFNEYFVIQQYVDNPNKIELEAIPQDSRFRDALVLYCEVAPDHIAKEIAAFCWDETKKITSADTIQLKRSIHSLRFLVEAFSLRKDVLSPFISNLGDLIFDLTENYVNNKHPLITKIAVEAVGIVDQRNMERTILKCFSINNWWINYTAIQSCRYLNNLGGELKLKLNECINYIEPQDILVQKDELLFSLSLTDTFKPIQSYLKLRILEIYLFIFSLISFIILNPKFGLIVFLVTFLAFLATGVPRNLFGKSFFPIQSRMTIFFEARISTIVYGIAAIAIYAPELVAFHNVYEFWGVSNPYFRSALHIINIASLIFFVPILDILLLLYKINSRMNFKINISWRDLLSAIVAFVILGIIVLLLGLGIGLLFKKFPGLKYTLFVIFGLLFGLAFIHFCISFVKDYRRLNQLRGKSQNSRESISESINSFDLDYFKYKYVAHLQQSNLVVVGQWPEDFNLVGNQKYRILLSQLDEKWLGL